MKQSKQLKRPCIRKIKLDRLSSLPGHIIDHILLQLPLRDAIRTSVLSTRWRYKWATLPDLVFDYQSISLTSKDHGVIKSKPVNIVDYVLLLHIGPISKFTLSLPYRIGAIDIERWILHLSRSPIKEFVLRIWKGPQYKLHSSLFSYQNLTHLKLFRCLIKPPLTFSGFKNLKSLYLENVTMGQDVCDNLISSCPLLEEFILMNFDGFGHLNINSPNLCFLRIIGVFDGITFTNTPRLAQVSIELNDGARITKQPLISSRLLEIFIHLPHIQRLEIESYFLKYLVASDVPSMLLNPCVDLDYLSVEIDFNVFKENKATLCLLRSSPNLQKLEIWVSRGDGSPTESCASFWDDEDRSSLFNQLRLVEITEVSGARLELEFISFLLLASPVLEKMTITPASTDKERPLMKELLQFQRLSVHAKIDYLDPL